MSRPTPVAAVAGAVVALLVAAVVNAVLTLIAGDTLVVPGELGLSQVLTYTLGSAIPAALVLWATPRWFAVVVVAVAVLTIPFPVQEFGATIGTWLGAMHLVTATCAALIAPRVAGALSRRTSADLRAS